ncbi:AMP-binding protein [Burkholderia vietnamiensis]|uniref:Long-chain-fatty-acid--CoA ligase n=1 Tax=Burkholderia vietnamiensis (strain G4 / LMG 22486) TaxID=269482 RepID=A4JQM3_BURVG|nr:AMP-binding protein [Burkholderia vietnamiensis]ABO58576.1 AMP-dependent synthetase and ligase [Burkholderia vietnamiensis G4]TPQ34246.1 long-chain fatty acid--CoA ligase [Burkholderia ubonensis]AJY08726.1 AMP-binding enzyme family protein [Burkholderia vietnamiensis LMG 10929]AOK02955.1 long-chain fatty acid--CoA ligase [Burkholderia vietnamiensis]AOK14467.1 long-chain fatty acid--CoA ligase [Burkholderia vietnamiensis]
MTKRHWIGSYGSIPAEIDPDRFPSVTALLDDAMRRFAGHPAFRASDRTLTYADVDRLSAALAAYLQQVAQVRKGDRVAVMLPNVLAFPVVFVALARIGAVQVNVNPLYTPHELEHQLNDAGVEVAVVCGGSMATFADVVGKTRVRTVLTVGRDDLGVVDAPAGACAALPPGSLALADAFAAGAALQRAPVALDGSDLLLLQYTGGTTGLSKGAALSHRNLIANVEQFAAIVPAARRPGEEVVVTAIPLYHIFALTVNFLSYFAIGAQNWLVANPRDMDGLIDVLKAARPSVFVGVNTLYAGLAGHPRLKEVDWSRLKLSAGGGAAVIDVISARWQAVTGNFIREGYGLSETSPVVTFNPQSVDRFTGTTGLPLPSTDVKLLDDENREVAIGGAGEICVRGPQVMGGYWQKPEANAAAFTEDGYFRTGDIGVFDAAGFLKIVDRKKDMIIVSGFNVYPNEVEAVVTALPGVAECACIGVPDERTGEAPKLFVVLAPDATVGEAEIVAHCRANLAGYKVPKQIRVVERLPKSTVGKILRRELSHAQ